MYLAQKFPFGGTHKHKHKNMINWAPQCCCMFGAAFVCDLEELRDSVMQDVYATATYQWQNALNYTY